MPLQSLTTKPSKRCVRASRLASKRNVTFGAKRSKSFEECSHLERVRNRIAIKGDLFMIRLLLALVMCCFSASAFAQCCKCPHGNAACKCGCKCDCGPNCNCGKLMGDVVRSDGACGDQVQFRTPVRTFMHNAPVRSFFETRQPLRRVWHARPHLLLRSRCR